MPDRRLVESGVLVRAEDETRLRSFLTARLTEDLARVWERAQTRADPRRHPGMAAQLEVIDELLARLGQGQLPERWELRVLIFGYRAHPDFDRAWEDALRG